MRLPNEIAESVQIHEGDRVEVEARDGAISIRPARTAALADIFAGKRPAEWRALYGGVFEWGPDVGREIVDE